MAKSACRLRGEEESVRLLNSIHSDDPYRSQEAWSRVLKLCQNQARRGIADAQEASEQTQDAALRAFSRLEGLNTPRRFTSWVNQISRNRARDHYKRRRHRDPYEGNFATSEQEDGWTQGPDDFSEGLFSGQIPTPIERHTGRRLMQGYLLAMVGALLLDERSPRMFQRSADYRDPRTLSPASRQRRARARDLWVCHEKSKGRTLYEIAVQHDEVDTTSLSRTEKTALKNRAVSWDRKGQTAMIYGAAAMLTAPPKGPRSGLVLPGWLLSLAETWEAPIERLRHFEDAETPFSELPLTGDERASLLAFYAKFSRDIRPVQSIV